MWTGEVQSIARASDHLPFLVRLETKLRAHWDLTQALWSRGVTGTPNCPRKVLAALSCTRKLVNETGRAARLAKPVGDQC